VSNELNIPREEWYHVIDKFTRIDELLVTLIKLVKENIDVTRSLIERVTGIAPTYIPAPEEVKPVVVQFPINNAYKIYKLDLRIARTDVALGLRKERLRSTYLTVLKADAPAFIKLNSTSYDLIECYEGLEIDNFEIEEVYVTNDATVSEAYLWIWLEWRV